MFALPVSDVKELERISKDQEKQLRSKIERVSGRPDSSNGGGKRSSGKAPTKIIIEETHLVSNPNDDSAKKLTRVDKTLVMPELQKEIQKI